MSVVPFYAAYMFLFATRESIAQGLETSDLATREEILSSSVVSEKVEEVILNGRDARLITVIADVHRRNCHQPLKVAIVYGAAHMRAVSRYLIQNLGYRVVGGNWVTIFEL